MNQKVKEGLQAYIAFLPIMGVIIICAIAVSKTNDFLVSGFLAVNTLIFVYAYGILLLLLTKPTKEERV